MAAILETVGSLEVKLKKILERYQFLKEENDILLANIDRLQQVTSQYEEELLAEREKYKMLKIAKTIEGSREDRKETKHKINTLVREIDKCIVKLSL